MMVPHALARLAGLFWVAWLSAWAVGPVVSATAADCTPVRVGLDPAIWNTFVGPINGRALGQTFFAPETLLSRLTVWRPPNFPSVVGAHLFITGVDTTRTPPRPVTSEILLDGPTLTVYDSDPPGQLIAMRFVIDPPLALPRPGLYAFFLQPEDCNTGEVWNIIANNLNPYPYGIYWITGRTAFLPCFLRAVDGGSDNTDLLFDIEFCQAATTPVRSRTWGRLKTIYR